MLIKKNLVILAEKKSNKHDHVFTKDKLMQRYQDKQYNTKPNILFYAKHT